MILGFDSETPPSAAQARAANLAGARLWSGYLATKGNVGIAHAWMQADFENARLAGGNPIGFCSGWDDPVGCKALAAQWNVKLCLDVETSIRADGAWVPAWLGLSGAGLYGGYTVHRGRTAAFHVMSGYPAVDPQLTWPTDQPLPNTPKGWQTRGTHSTPFGSVDSGWYDDWFTAGSNPQPQPTPEDEDMLIQFTYNGGEFLSNNLMTYRHIPDQATAGDVAFVVNNLGLPLKLYSPAINTGHIRAFGVPLDAESAAAAGDVWPVAVPGPKGDPGVAGAPGSTAPHSHDVPGTATSTV